MGPSTPLGAIWSPKVCEAHPDMRNTSLLGGSGGMPPRKFLNFMGALRCFLVHSGAGMEHVEARCVCYY